MQYPLPEKIGNPELFVGRDEEFRNFNRWLNYIPNKLAKSRVILARRKSGKTAFVQRIFNQLWSEHGRVIPFYLDIPESKIWYPMFAIKYFSTFASQYISFLERDDKLVSQPLSLEQIKEYGVAKSHQLLIDYVDSLLLNRERGWHDLMWDTAYNAPHRFAAVLDLRFLVILDEFQNLAQYIYPDPEYRASPIETMPGSFHSVVESKIAPMLVTGSYVSWLIAISGKYLEAGRLSEWYLPPYLTPAEGLQAVYKYAGVYNEAITNQTAVQINQLCMADPFFISCVIQSNYRDKDLTTAEGVINTVNYEITDRRSEMFKTWDEYLQLTLQKINDRYAKSMLLYLSKHPDRYWTPQELRAELHLDLELDEIHKRLLLLVEADVLEWGSSDIQFRGLQDGTLNLIIRSRFEQEIKNLVPDLRQDFHQQVDALMQDKRRLQGLLNQLTGKMAEHLLAGELRSRKRFSLSAFFQGVQDATRLNIINVQERLLMQRTDGKTVEIDIKADSSCGRVVLLEVKKTTAKTGIEMVQDFYEKVAIYGQYHPNAIILPAFLSLGGFTDNALKFCAEKGIGTAESIEFFQ